MNKKPDKNDLLDLLADIPHEWYKIGLALHVGEPVLENLARKKDSDIANLDRVIRSWMDTMNSDITWHTIIKAVGGRIVKNKATAEMICNFLAQPKIYEKYSEQKDFNGPMDRNL